MRKLGLLIATGFVLLASSFDTDDILHHTAAEYIVLSSVGGEGASALDQAVGQAVKEQMKPLETALRELWQDIATIRQPDEGVLMVIPGDFLFKSGRSELRDASLPYLQATKELLAQYPQFRTYILVHTDDNGSDFMSMDLSEHRAKVLKKCLQQDTSVKISGKGKGALVPVISNASDAGRQLNRRVEFAIVAKGKLIRDLKRQIKQQQ